MLSLLSHDALGVLGAMDTVVQALECEYASFVEQLAMKVNMEMLLGLVSRNHDGELEMKMIMSQKTDFVIFDTDSEDTAGVDTEYDL